MTDHTVDTAGAETPGAETPGAPHTASIGRQLRDRREQRGLTLEQVVAQTRIPLRHLRAIEQDDFQALPARTYALGFVRSYARLLEMDEAAAVDAVRAELDRYQPEPEPRPATFEPGDPARVPSIGLGWISLGVVVLLIVAGYFLLPRLFVPAAQLPSLYDQQQAEQAAAAAAASEAAAARTQAAGPAGAATPSGPVVFTALEEGIWVKFYDAAGRQLMQKLMAKGETYTVPADAEGPQLWTGRPEALSITIGGRAVPPLATQQSTMRDVPISAAALMARAAAGAAADPAAATPGAAAPAPAPATAPASARPSPAAPASSPAA